jgi:hypothetical protein
MGVHITDDSMSLEIGGATVNAAVRLDNLWRVTGWPRLLSRNEAITALTLAEWLLSGRSADALCVAAWREVAHLHPKRRHSQRHPGRAATSLLWCASCAGGTGSVVTWRRAQMVLVSARRGGPRRRRAPGRGLA